MALRSVENILTGVPTLYIQAFSSGASIVSSNAISAGSFTQLPFQGDGGGTVQVNIGVEPHETMVADFSSAIAAHTNIETCEIVVKLSEASTEALQYAVGASTYAAGATPGTNPDTLTFGDGTIAYYNLSFYVDRISSDSNTEVAFDFHKVYIVGPPQISFGRGTTPEYEVTFKCLSDTALSAGARIFTVTELTNA